MNQMDAKAPFFIVGCPRSGTTLLQVLLDAHPHIAIPPESHIFARFSSLFPCYGDLREPSNLRLLVQDILHDEPLKRWKLDVSVDDFCSRLTDRSVRGCISLLFDLYAEREGKTRWGDKTPQHMMYLREIKHVFPEAKIIHMVRDGRDVAESLSRVLIGPKSVYGIARRWNAYISAFDEFKTHLGPDEYLEVHYEQLVQDPDAELARLLRFVGEEYAVASGASLRTNRTRQYVSARTIHGSLSQAVSMRKIGVFREKFRTRDIEIFEAIAANSLKNCGYSLLSSGRTQIRLYEKLKFFLQDYLYRYLVKLIRPDMLNLVIKQIKFDIQLRLRKFLRTRAN